MSSEQDESFVGEQITPAAGTADASAMATGEPGLPERFTWRGTEYTVAAVLRKWKESGPCRSGGGEIYLRKHWFEVLTTSHHTMTVYFERQPRRGCPPTARWWLFTVTNPTA
jgi:hypothetical protein